MSKVLIIEQDSFFGDVMMQKITEAGFGVTIVNNGAIALEQINIESPDLIVLDMEMTNSDPITILKNKSKDKSIAGIPVIIISRSGDLTEIKRVVDLGVKDYLVKAQLNLDELVLKVKSLLRTSAPASNAKNILEGKTIMWVEDDQFLSDLISRKLSAQGSKLLYARNGEEALKLLESNTPDILILDILLPGISGFDVLEKVKGDSKLKNVPVVVLSNFSQNNEIDRAKKLGANRFLIKASIVLDDLVRELQAVISERK